MQVATTQRRWSMGWLESLLLIAFLGLVVQLVPSSTSFFLGAISPREWGAWGWLTLNVGVLLVLLGLRCKRPLLHRLSKVAAMASCGWGVLVVFREIVPFLASWAYQVLALLDFRVWSQTGWLTFSIILLVALCAARFAPELANAISSSWANVAEKRRAQAKVSRTVEKTMSEKEERALYERLAEARKKQVVRG
jgi:hypothetical protein